MATLFERLGGFAGVSKVVSDFYDRVLDDDTLAPYFEHVDMRRLIDHQTKFISAVMGGPASYTNEALRRAHSHIEIDRPTFDVMRSVLEACLAAHGLSDEDRATVLDEIEARAPYVITRS